MGRIRIRNRERILAAAEAVFSERGYEGATTALIAKKAGIPKANLHYYFPTKLHIYKETIAAILHLWLSPLDNIQPGDDPAVALSRYIREKIEYSRTRPMASRVFANEVIAGAPVIRKFLSNELRNWVQQKCSVFRHWADTGMMAPLRDPEHLFFIIWAATQTYADFGVQIAVVLGKKKISAEDYDAGAELLTRMVLSGCEIQVPSSACKLKKRRTKARSG